MQDINLKAFQIPGFQLDENCEGNVGEVFYVQDSSGENCIEIIPESNNHLRPNKKIYIILYLKDCQVCKAGSFTNEIEDPAEALENMNNWIKAAAASLFE